LKQQENKLVAKVCEDGLRKLNPTYLEKEVSQDDLCSAAQMESHLVHAKVKANTREVRQLIQNLTAWRIEGTLREFPKFKPVNMWFNYPTHKVDTSGVLKDIELDDAFGSKGAREKGLQKIKENNAKVKADKEKELSDAISLSNFGEPPTVKMVAESLGVTERTIQKRIKESENFYIDKNDGFIKPRKANE